MPLKTALDYARRLRERREVDHSARQCQISRLLTKVVFLVVVAAVVALTI